MFIEILYHLFFWLNIVIEKREKRVIKMSKWKRDFVVFCHSCQHSGAVVEEGIFMKKERSILSQLLPLNYFLNITVYPVSIKKMNGRYWPKTSQKTSQVCIGMWMVIKVFCLRIHVLQKLNYKEKKVIRKSYWIHQKMDEISSGLLVTIDDSSLCRCRNFFIRSVGVVLDSFDSLECLLFEPFPLASDASYSYYWTSSLNLFLVSFRPFVAYNF